MGLGWGWTPGLEALLVTSLPDYRNHSLVQDVTSLPGSVPDQETSEDLYLPLSQVRITLLPGDRPIQAGLAGHPWEPQEMSERSIFSLWEA